MAEDNAKTKIPAWVWVVIIILVILLIVIPIIVWLVSRGQGGPSGGTGTTCTTNANCATGLVCTNGTCSLPPCLKPSNISVNSQVTGFNDVSITWSADNADVYFLVFQGGIGNEFANLSANFFTTETSHVFESVPSGGYFVLIVPISNTCGIDEDVIGSDNGTVLIII